MGRRMGMPFAGHGMLVLKRHGVHLANGHGPDSQTDEQEGDNLTSFTRDPCQHSTPLYEDLTPLLSNIMHKRREHTCSAEIYREPRGAVKEEEGENALPS